MPSPRPGFCQVTTSCHITSAKPGSVSLASCPSWFFRHPTKKLVMGAGRGLWEEEVLNLDLTEEAARQSKDNSRPYLLLPP